MHRIVRCASFAVAAFTIPGFVLGGEAFPIDARHSTIGFSIGIAGGLTKVDGAFESFQGEVDYDREDLSKSRVSITIDAASVDTGVAGRDAHLRDTDFFDAPKFPTITFQSKSIEREDDRHVLVGPLTMHGVTRTVRIPFRRMHAQPVVTLFGTPSIVFEGSVKLKRANFGIAGTSRWNSLIEATGEMAMSDEVEIHLRIIGHQPAPRK